MAKHEDGMRIDPAAHESGCQFMAKIEMSGEDDRYTDPIWDSEQPGFAEDDSGRNDTRLPLDQLLR